VFASSSGQFCSHSRIEQVEIGDQVADGQSVASACSGQNQHLPDCDHSHTAMMNKSEQIDPAAHEILDVPVHARNAAKRNLRTLQIDE
jgi:hypothetical protein